MPHANIWEWHGVVMSFWGVVAGRDFVRAIQDIAADADFDDLRFVIIDLSDVKQHTIDEAALEDIVVSRIGAIMTNPNIRTVLVTPDEHIAAIARAMNREPLTGTHEVKNFPSQDAAREWLQQQPVLTMPRRRA